MKLAVILFVALFLIGGCCADSEPFSLRQLLKSATASSSASAKSTKGGSASSTAATISRGGTAEAVAAATSESFTEVSNQLVEYFKYVDENLPSKSYRQSDEEYCQDALAVIETELEAAGSVTASAYTDALAEVHIEGSGEACASADASASTQATGYAKILVEAITDASIGVSESKAAAAVEVVSEVIASAFSSAFSTACLEGEGTGLALQTTLATAIARPLASVSVLVASGIDCSTMEGYAKAEVEGVAAPGEETTTVESTTTAEITGEGDVEAGGTGTAEAATIEQCYGIYYLCCRERGEVCTCSRTKTVRCNAVLKTVGDIQYWDDAENEVKCRCSKSMSMSVIIT